MCVDTPKTLTNIFSVVKHGANSFFTRPCRLSTNRTSISN